MLTQFLSGFLSANMPRKSKVGPRVDVASGFPVSTMTIGASELGKIATSMGYAFVLELGPMVPGVDCARVPQARFYKLDSAGPSLALVLALPIRGRKRVFGSTFWRRQFAFSTVSTTLCRNFAEVSRCVQAGVLPASSMEQAEDLNGVWNRLWREWRSLNRAMGVSKILGLSAAGKVPGLKKFVLPSPVPKFATSSGIKSIRKCSPRDPRVHREDDGKASSLAPVSVVSSEESTTPRERYGPHNFPVPDQPLLDPVIYSCIACDFSTSIRSRHLQHWRRGCPSGSVFSSV